MASPNVSQPTFLRIGTSGTITGMHSKLKLAVFKTSLSVPVGAMIATIPKTAFDSRMVRAATRWFHFAVAFVRDHLQPLAPLVRNLESYCYPLRPDSREPLHLSGFHLS